jgi:hypothetical protein
MAKAGPLRLIPECLGEQTRQLDDQGRGRRVRLPVQLLAEDLGPLIFRAPAFYNHGVWTSTNIASLSAAWVWRWLSGCTETGLDFWFDAM